MGNCCLEEEPSIPFEQKSGLLREEEANVALSHFSIAVLILDLT